MNRAQDGVHSRVLERRCDVHNSQAIKHEDGGGCSEGGAQIGLPVLINLLLV